MPASPQRIHTIFNWIGAVLAFPFVAVGIIGAVWWLRGEFPATVDINTVSLVLALLLAGGVIVYVILWAAGRLVSAYLREN